MVSYEIPMDFCSRHPAPLHHFIPPETKKHSWNRLGVYENVSNYRYIANKNCRINKSKAYHRNRAPIYIYIYTCTRDMHRMPCFLSNHENQLMPPLLIDLKLIRDFVPKGSYCGPARIRTAQNANHHKNLPRKIPSTKWEDEERHLPFRCPWTAPGHPCTWYVVQWLREREIGPRQVAHRLAQGSPSSTSAAVIVFIHQSIHPSIRPSQNKTKDPTKWKTRKRKVKDFPRYDLAVVFSSLLLLNFSYAKKTLLKTAPLAIGIYVYFLFPAHRQLPPSPERLFKKTV